MMSILFIAVVVAICVWWLVAQRLTEKPWVTVGTAEQDLHAPASSSKPMATLGLAIFIAVITSFFSLFISAYLMRMSLADWKPLAEPGLLWINSGALLCSSVALHLARSAVQREQRRRLQLALVGAGVLAIAFLAGQLVAWQQLDAAGHYMRSNPASAFFYLLTALHGLHLAGGLWVLCRAILDAWRAPELARISMRVQLCSIYWHYLLLVWAVLFALLLTT